MTFLDKLTPAVRSRFERWAYMNRYDIAKDGDTYVSSKTRAAFEGFVGATDICHKLCVQNALYYVEGTAAANAASNCAEDVLYEQELPK
jgi:hypothetical protein